MNRIRLRGVLFCADAAPADNVIRLADSNTIARRIFNISRQKQNSAFDRRFGLVLLCDRFVTAAQKQDRAANRARRMPPNKHILARIAITIIFAARASDAGH